MKKVRIGVFGASRGHEIIDICRKNGEAEIVAVCDKEKSVLDRYKKISGLKTYSSFDEFIECDMDGVVLANYANEHAPYAIKCLEKGLHVLSEVLPFASLKEAVDLVEAVEKSKKVYSYAENYCYMPAALEMKKIYRSGELGELEYAEGEYIHNCEPIWPDITYGDETHWRNNKAANFYCTHSIGPLLFVTGLRPVKVTGFELPFTGRTARMGCKSGIAGIEMLTLENGAVIKSVHGNLDKDSVWYSFYGEKGRMESARYDSNSGEMRTLYTNIDSAEGVWDGKVEKLSPKSELAEKAEGCGHFDSDYYPIHHFIEAIKGGKGAEIIDVYSACDYALPGILGYYSVLDGGAPKEIPNLRIKEERDKVRNDDRRVGKDFPSYSKGELDIDEGVYKRIREIYLKRRGN